MAEHRTAIYRTVIDRVAVDCTAGQGQIAANRVRAGVWHPDADAGAPDLADQRELNEILRQLDPRQCEVLAEAMAAVFVGGAFSVFQALYACEVEPFENGYEGSPSEDVIGRVGGWDWPEA